MTEPQCASFDIFSTTLASLTFTSFVIEVSAPFSSNSLTSDSCPLITAIMRAVLPSLSTLLMFVPCRINVIATSALPVTAAENKITEWKCTRRFFYYVMSIL